MFPILQLFFSSRYSSWDILVLSISNRCAKRLLGHERKKTIFVLDGLDILTSSRLILITDSMSATGFPHAALKVSAIILVEYSRTVYWDVHFDYEGSRKQAFWCNKNTSILWFLFSNKMFVFEKVSKTAESIPHLHFPSIKLKNQCNRTFVWVCNKSHFLPCPNGRRKWKLLSVVPWLPIRLSPFLWQRTKGF